MSLPQPAPLHAEDLYAVEFNDRRVELWEGELIEMSPAFVGHGKAGTPLFYLLMKQRESLPPERRDAMFISSFEIGFLLSRNPDTLLVPDLLVTPMKDADAAEETGFINAPPTVAIEVLSKSERPREVQRKVGLYLNAGTEQVWLVDPRTKTITIYFTDRVPPLVARPGDVIECEGFLAGFNIPVSEIFP